MANPPAAHDILDLPSADGVRDTRCKIDITLKLHNGYRCYKHGSPCMAPSEQSSARARCKAFGAGFGLLKPRCRACVQGNDGG